MYLYVLLGLMSSLTISVSSAPEIAEISVSEIVRAELAHFEREYGRWRVVNSVMKGPGEFAELHFIVETSPTLNGYGVKTDWYDAASGEFFGEVIRTYNPASEMIDQHYFAAKASKWSTTAQEFVVTENGHSAAFSGEDKFGSFEARTNTTFLPDGGGYDWTIERRYNGGDWFLIDRGEARPLTQD
ncbi:hypothetical protein [Hyphococcus sp.]|uniref:hypothetical protein n=1 Tax=Hyphococcus sp. TaxID=2038636 RepID=UPI00208460F7|nr:MAG: hypothetical protein DHS20C04_25700 [Marinicaulis sp.]